MDKIEYKERVDKPCLLSGDKILDRKLKDRLRLSKLIRSRPSQRFHKKLEKELQKKYEEDQDNEVLDLRKKIQKRRKELTVQLKLQFINEGKNLDNAGTWKSLINWRERILTEEFGILPSNIENCSLTQAKHLLFTNFEKQHDPLDKDNFIFDKKDEDLDPISRLGKHDPRAWVSTMMRLELYRQAKRAGRLGMYQDQNGVFQI